MLLPLLCSLALGMSPATSHAITQAGDLLDAWQLEDARAEAETLLLHAPEEPAAQVLAAEVLHQQGRHMQALALWRSAQASPTARSHLLEPVLRASAGYAAFFQEDETTHFRLHYMDKDAIVASYAASVLEAAYSRIGADLGFLPAERDEKIVVEIYPDARGLAGATGLTLKEIETSGTIAVCKFHRLMVTSPLATSEGYAWADTMAHEFIHLLISKRSHNNIPVWFHEGVAKYYESRWKGPAGQALTPYGEQLLARAQRKDDFVSFKQMHPSMAKLKSQEQAALAFAEVFTVVAYINERYGPKAIAHILQDVGQGHTLEQAFVRILKTDLAGLERAWKRSLHARQFKDVQNARPDVIRLADNGGQQSQQRPLEDMEDKQVHDWARLGELLQIRQRTAAAVTEYEKAIQHSGMRYASLVNRLARAYVDLGQIERADALLSQSLAAHPDDSDAHLLAGRIALKGDRCAAARLHFEAVRLQNPFNPEMHQALTKLYAHDKDVAGAALEARFLQLSTTPRPVRDTSAARQASKDAATAKLGHLRVVTKPWRQVQIDDGAPVQTPLWDVALAPGAHVVHVDAHGFRFDVQAGQTTSLTPDITPTPQP